MREQAVRYAARYLEPARLVRLVANDERAVLRNGAIAALERQGPYAVPPLEMVLAGPVDAELAMFTLQVLARIADHHSAAAVLPFVRHANANVAQAAIEALGAFRAAEAVPDLLALMGGNLWLQLASVNALGEIGDARAAGPLLELAPDSLLAIPALQALGKLPAAAVAVPLAQLVCDVREPASREAALLALADVVARNPSDPAASRALSIVGGSGRRAHPAPHARRVRLPRPTMRPRLRACVPLPQPSPSVRRSAPPGHQRWWPWRQGARPPSSRTLLRLPGPRLVPLVASHYARRGSPRPLHPASSSPQPRSFTPSLLFDALRDPHALVRAAACRALGPLQLAESVAPAGGTAQGRL